MAWERLRSLTRKSREPQATALEQEVAEMFADLRPGLLRYLLTLGLETADGEDVVQEVFLALFRHLQAGKPRTHLRGWVYRVGRNLALKRRLALAPADCLPDAFLADPAPNPEELATRGKANERLRSVVEALPERDRQCLFLRAEGLRYREIAEALEMSLGGVSESLSRSVAKLATSWKL